MGSGVLDEARQAGRYLAKYVSKGMAEGWEFGLHRYDVAQNFHPTVELIRGNDAADVVREASERIGVPAGQAVEVSPRAQLVRPACPLGLMGRGMSAGGVRASSTRRRTPSLRPETVRQWVAQSCAEQGIALKVQDPVVLAQGRGHARCRARA